MFNSRNYWENRYKNNGNSGSGSYHGLAQFKASIINKFISENNVHSIIDYGVGDGNQLRLIDTHDKQYTGIDVSPTIIEKCKQLFKEDPTKTFIMDTDIQDNHQAELVLSCDVIYHLIEDPIYTNYMNKLFAMATTYVIIYAKNEDIQHTAHVRFRKFTNYIDTYLKSWKLIKVIPNKYPQKVLGKNNETTSPSDFYIFKNFHHEQIILRQWSDYIETRLLPIIKVNLEGNIYSRHNSKEKYTNLEPKVYNIVLLFGSHPPKQVLEIGFNAGFSSLLMKMSGVKFDLTCIDINCHEYVVPCFNTIHSDYTDMEILLEPSSKALKGLIQQKKTYDIIHIDGDHSLEGARTDLELCLRLAHDDTIIIFDDTNLPHLSALCQNYVNQQKIQPYAMKNFMQCKEYKHDFFKKKKK